MARKRGQQGGPKYYTTFDVAKFLGVSAPTVVNWVNGGLLQAHRTPGGHRRMTREDILAFTHAHDLPAPRELDEDQEDGAPSTDGRRVLIVDDEADFCNLVRDFLVARGGWEVEVAHSGFAAGVAVARFRPVVVLMDLMMPDMDGFEVLHVLQKDPEMREIPVIACTAWRDPAVEERVRGEAFSGYVQKPLRLDAFVGLLESTLNARASR